MSSFVTLKVNEMIRSASKISCIYIFFEIAHGKKLTQNHGPIASCWFRHNHMLNSTFQITLVFYAHLLFMKPLCHTHLLIKTRLRLAWLSKQTESLGLG